MNKIKNISFRSVLYHVLIVLVAILICSGTYSIYQFLSKDSNISHENEFIIEEINSNEEEESKGETVVEEYHNPLPDYRREYQNSNIMAKIEIPGLNIDTLVTKTDNNDYYLTYNLYNQNDGLGAPFFDFRNNNLASDKQINIYAHNTQNEKYLDQLPFTKLEAYTDENTFHDAKDIYLSIDEAKIHYEVVAIKIVTTDAEHMKIKFYEDSSYLSHVYKLISNSLYSKDYDFTENDRILVLQICHYDPEGSYLLVIGKEKK